jgi:DNA-binding PadR family transcriptional regulator
VTPSKKFLGEFEQMIIAAVMGLGDDAYGVSIIESIARHTGRRVKSGALSVTLDRMERKGLVESRLGDAGEGRAGRRRRYVHVTPEGREMARESRTALLNLWRDVEEAYDRP